MVTGNGENTINVRVLKKNFIKSKYVSKYMHPKWLRVLSNFRLLDCDVEFKTWLKLWENAFICQQNELTYGIQAKYFWQSTAWYRHLLFSTFESKQGKKRRRGRVFFSSWLIFLLWHFSDILVNFPLHLFIFFTSPALVTFKPNKLK